MPTKCHKCRDIVTQKDLSDCIINCIHSICAVWHFDVLLLSYLSGWHSAQSHKIVSSQVCAHLSWSEREITPITILLIFYWKEEMFQSTLFTTFPFKKTQTCIFFIFITFFIHLFLIIMLKSLSKKNLFVEENCPISRYLSTSTNFLCSGLRFPLKLDLT